jgi:hypothetical protein
MVKAGLRRRISLTTISGEIEIPLAEASGTKVSPGSYSRPDRGAPFGRNAMHAPTQQLIERSDEVPEFRGHAWWDNASPLT